MPVPRIFISHSAHEREAKRLLDEIEKALKERGFEPFVDRQRLLPGAVWRDELYSEILGCHGAVILFSEAALKSNWVFFEAAALAPRRWMHPEEFMLIPVLLPMVHPRVLTMPPFEPFDLARLQVIKSATEGDVQRIVNYFLPLLDSFRDSPLDLLKEVVLEAMPRKQAALERAARQLGVPVTDILETRRAVAHACFHAAVQPFYQAMSHLTPAMTREGAAKTIDIILPFWVRPEAVLLLAQAALNPPPRSVSLLNADDKLIAGLYVRRAAAQYPLPWTVIPVTASGGERTSGSVIGEIRHFFRTQLDDRDSTDEEIDKRIAGRTRIAPVVVIFPPTTRAETIIDVRKKYPECTYLVRTGNAVPHTDRFRGLEARVLTPPLQPGQEDEAADFNGVLKTMLDNMQ